MGRDLCAELTPEKFRIKGWEVGKRHDGRDDRCPACVNRQQEKLRKKFRVIANEESILKVEQKQIDSSRGSDAKIEPPREMTRDHRRLIFLKLEEVYIDEKAGYSSGWGDAKLALDLGVPRSWVSTIRDENFGPGTSEEIEQTLTEVRALKSDYEAFKESAAKLIAQSGDISKRLDTLQKIAVRIEQTVR